LSTREKRAKDCDLCRGTINGKMIDLAGAVISGAPPFDPNSDVAIREPFGTAISWTRPGVTGVNTRFNCLADLPR